MYGGGRNINAVVTGRAGPNSGSTSSRRDDDKWSVADGSLQRSARTCQSAVGLKPAIRDSRCELPLVAHLAWISAQRF